MKDALQRRRDRAIDPRRGNTIRHHVRLLAHSVTSSVYRTTCEQLALRPQRWLISGVAGFIGSNLLERLLSLGQHVVGIDDFSTGRESNLDEVLAATHASGGRFVLLEGDIRDADLCARGCTGVDYVLHQAALASVPLSIQDPARTHSVNVDGFFNVLDAARRAGVSRMVYASSSAVYGDAVGQPQREEVIGRPLSPYAAQKAMDESCALAFQAAYGLESIGLRYYNIFGPRQDPGGAYSAVIPRWISTLSSDAQCTIFGDGETTRDFCDVADVVQANILAATVGDPAATGQVYNVASARSLTLNELFALLVRQLEALGSPPAYPRPAFEDFRPGDVRSSSASIEKARRLLGYEPSRPIDVALEELVRWHLARRIPSLPFAGSPTFIA